MSEGIPQRPYVRGISKPSTRAVFREVIRNTDISELARMVWMTVYTFADNDGTNAYPSMETIAGLLGRKDLRPIRLALQELIDAGLLARSYRQNGRFQSNLYTIIEPQIRQRKERSP